MFTDDHDDIAKSFPTVSVNELCLTNCLDTNYGIQIVRTCCFQEPKCPLIHPQIRLQNLI